MNTIRKIVAATLAIGFIAALSSCNKHTCPTYSKAGVEQVQEKA